MEWALAGCTDMTLDLRQTRLHPFLPVWTQKAPSPLSKSHRMNVGDNSDLGEVVRNNEGMYVHCFVVSATL